MSRRVLPSLIFAAMFLVPTLGTALPRPQGVEQQGQEITISTIRVQANDSIGVATPALSKGRAYAFVITGRWKPTSSSTNFADAAFETTNNSTWSRTGKGLAIGFTNLGGSGSPIASFDSGSNYRVSFTGSGSSENLRIIDPVGNSDNTGFLDVSIKTLQVATYEWKTERAIDEFFVQQEVPTTTVTAGSVGPINIPGGNVGGNVIPLLGNLIFNHNQQGQYCITVSPTSGSPIPVGCVFDPAGSTSPLPNQTIPIGGGQLPSVSACNPSCEVIPGTPLPSVTVPGQKVKVGVPAGTKVQVTFSWTADLLRIYKSNVDDTTFGGNGDNVLYSPFNPFSLSDVTWYQSQVAANKLSLNVSLKLTDSNGQTIGQPVAVSIPGLGQVVEAMFTTRVLGT